MKDYYDGRMTFLELFEIGVKKNLQLFLPL